MRTIPAVALELLRLAVQHKIQINSHRQQYWYADNHKHFFSPRHIVSTSTRMHCEFLHLLFLQAHRETGGLQAHLEIARPTWIDEEQIRLGRPGLDG